MVHTKCDIIIWEIHSMNVVLPLFKYLCKSTLFSANELFMMSCIKHEQIKYTMGRKMYNLLACTTFTLFYTACMYWILYTVQCTVFSVCIVQCTLYRTRWISWFFSIILTRFLKEFICNGHDTMYTIARNIYRRLFKVRS